MAGHNKWSKVKHKKAKTDAKKGNIFTRLGREIQVAAKAGGPDPNYNAQLRQAVDRAMAENMPNDNIQRAIKKGAGLLEGQEIEEVYYEGYGPAGVAVLVSCLTDNRNRTVGELRFAFNKAGGSLGESGSVAWMFKRIGLVGIEAPGKGEDAVTEAAIEAGAEDVRPGDDDGAWEIVCADTDVHAVQTALAGAGLKIREFGITYEPTTSVALEGEPAEKVMRFMETLDDVDDVQNVYANFDISDAELERIAAADL